MRPCILESSSDCFLRDLLRNGSADERCTPGSLVGWTGGRVNGMGVIGGWARMRLAQPLASLRGLPLEAYVHRSIHPRAGSPSNAPLCAARPPREPGLAGLQGLRRPTRFIARGGVHGTEVGRASDREQSAEDPQSGEARGRMDYPRGRSARCDGTKSLTAAADGAILTHGAGKVQCRRTDPSPRTLYRRMRKL